MYKCVYACICMYVFSCTFSCVYQLILINTFIMYIITYSMRRRLGLIIIIFYKYSKTLRLCCNPYLRVDTRMSIKLHYTIYSV